MIVCSKCNWLLSNVEGRLYGDERIEVAGDCKRCGKKVEATGWDADDFNFEGENDGESQAEM